MLTGLRIPPPFLPPRPQSTSNLPRHSLAPQIWVASEPRRIRMIEPPRASEPRKIHIIELPRASEPRRIHIIELSKASEPNKIRIIEPRISEPPRS